MKIALIGYGKMGRAIEAIAKARGHEIVAVIDIDNHADMDTFAFCSADVAIEFTNPSTAFDNYMECFDRGVKVVSGSTGWTEKMPLVRERCDNEECSFLWSSNFSIGVNVTFALNRYLSSLMERVNRAYAGPDGEPLYRPSLFEVHHVHKKDHPSGTALSLARDLIERSGNELTGWAEDTDSCAPDLLPIGHERRGEVPGIHEVKWTSACDYIKVEHSAESRDGFALGAVMAAEWLAGQSGFHTIEEAFAPIYE